MQLIKMLLGTLVLFSGAQISSSESTKTSTQHIITQNKNKKGKPSFWSTRFHNPKMMLSIGNKKLDIKKIIFALTAINMLTKDIATHSVGFLLCLYTLIKDPKNWFVDGIIQVIAVSTAMIPPVIVLFNTNSQSNKAIDASVIIYTLCIKTLATVGPYLGAAYVTGTFSPIVDDTDSDNFDNASTDN